LSSGSDTNWSLAANTPTVIGRSKLSRFLGKFERFPHGTGYGFVEMGVKWRELKLLAAFSAKEGRFAGPRN
jgi:hypothetical protein